MCSSTIFTTNPQDSDPGTGKNIFCSQQISSFVIAVAYTSSALVTVVAFQRKNIQHGYVSSIGPDQHGSTFSLKAGKDIALMKIYRYHSNDVLRRNERGRLVAKLSFLSRFYSVSFPLPLLISDYITGRIFPKEQTGLERKNRVASCGTPSSSLFDCLDFNLSQSRRQRSRDYVAGQLQQSHQLSGSHAFPLRR